MQQLSNRDSKSLWKWLESPRMKREIIELAPGRVVYFGMLRIENTGSSDTLYIRKGAQSISVSKRKAANYGRKKK